MTQKTHALMEILMAQPVMPVVAVDSAADAVKLARALAAGGLPGIEVTLRTPAALDAIRQYAHTIDTIARRIENALDQRPDTPANEATRLTA